MSKVAIIGIGAAVAAIGVVWAWRDRGKVERDLKGVVKRIVSDEVNRAKVWWTDETTKAAKYGRREATSAHHRLDDLEAQVKTLVSDANELALRSVRETNAHARIEGLSERVKALAHAAHTHHHPNEGGQPDAGTRQRLDWMDEESED